MLLFLYYCLSFRKQNLELKKQKVVNLMVFVKFRMKTRETGLHQKLKNLEHGILLKKKGKEWL